MATVAKSDMLTRVKTLSQTPESGIVILSDTEVNSAIDDALRDYNLVKPAEATEDIVGAGLSYFLLSDVLDEWDNDVSRLWLVEYPAATIADDETPIYQDADNDYEIYNAESGQYLRFFVSAPSTSETVRITYTHSRAFDSGNLIMPDIDVKALEHQAASIVCESLATYFGRGTDVGGIGASQTDWQTKGDAFRRMSEAFHKKFTEHFTNKVNEVDAGIMIVDRDQTWPRPLDGDYLFRPRRSR